MARKVKVNAEATSEEPTPDALSTQVSTAVGRTAKKHSSNTPKADSHPSPLLEDKASASKPKSTKRKAPVHDAASDNEGAVASPPPAGPALKKQKPKQKKNRKQANEENALYDFDLGINTIFARMDPDLIADYVAANTKRFATDLSPIELSDLYVPSGAIRDTTSFAETRVKETLPEFLERCVLGGSEVEQKRLGSAPKEKGAPHTIVVAAAGLRAADLVRVAKKFQKKENCIAKLVGCYKKSCDVGGGVFANGHAQFAKHFKVAEQVDFLQKNRTGIAVGTPTRLIDLLDNGESRQPIPDCLRKQI